MRSPFHGWLPELLLAGAASLIACNGTETDGRGDSFHADAFKIHVRALANDSMEGRFPGTVGGERAATYIEEAMRQAGLEHTADAEGFRHSVPLVGTRVDAAGARVSLHIEGRAVEVDPQALLLRTESDRPRVERRARLVFVGHGVSAPEYGHDDYEDASVAGAWAVVLPGVPAPSSMPGGANGYAATTDAKLAAARRHGAVGVWFLSDPDGDEERFRASRAVQSGMDNLRDDWTETRRLEAVVDLGPAGSRELLEAVGVTWAGLVTDPADPAGAAAWPSMEAETAFDVAVGAFEAPNLVGIIPGTDNAAEAVVITAHYDAYGIAAPNEEGDSIYNGATDNAAGTAGLLMMARHFANADPPERTLVFVATTAEEGGMLGARGYVDRPVVPLDRTVVNINIDGLGFRPPTEDFQLFPATGLTIGPALEALAAKLDMELTSEPWQPGMHFAFDTKAFMAAGIVGFTVWQGSRVREAHRSERPDSGPIHTPDDEYHESWSDAGIEQHLGLYRTIIDHWARGAAPPAFEPDSPLSPVGTPPDR